MSRPSMLTIAIAASLALTTSFAAASATNPQDGLVHYSTGEGKYPFSPAVKAGNTVYLSGQIGADANGIGKDFDTQARLAMDNVLSAAKLAGIGPDHIAKCTVMLADMKNWDAFNKIYRTYFQPGQFPARSAFGVTGLALGAALEVECIGYAASPAASQ